MKKTADFQIPKNIAEFVDNHDACIAISVYNNYLPGGGNKLSSSVHIYLKKEEKFCAPCNKVFSYLSGFPKTLEESFDMWLAMQKNDMDKPVVDDVIPYSFIVQRDYDNYFKMMEVRNGF